MDAHSKLAVSIDVHYSFVYYCCYIILLLCVWCFFVAKYICNRKKTSNKNKHTKQKCRNVLCCLVLLHVCCVCECALLYEKRSVINNRNSQDLIRSHLKMAFDSAFHLRNRQDSKYTDTRAHFVFSYVWIIDCIRYNANDLGISFSTFRVAM